MERAEALSSLIAAERGFATAASENGIQAAFLAHLTDDAVLFRPGPVTGVEYLRSTPPSAGLLAWDPEFADVSSDGRFGYTTGPWVYRKEPEGRTTVSGRYLTFWRRGPGGEWKAVIDHGVAGPVDERSLDPTSPVARPITPPGLQSLDDRGYARAGLLNADSALGKSFGDPAARAHIAADVRVLRGGLEPAFGADALGRAVADGSISFQALGAGVAPASGDLGYTYGEYTLVPPDTTAEVQRGTYVRGWRHDGRSWRLVVDLMNPLPPGV